MIKYTISIISDFIEFITYKVKSLISYSQKNKINKVGNNVYIGHNSKFTYQNITIGNNVYIGERASFISSISKIYVGNCVMFGPNVTIRGGNYRIDIIGAYIYDIKDDQKLEINDQDVYIEDDVWIGCNVTILKGVTISRGSVVAAGAIVNKSCPPYSIIGGNPAKVIKMRFTTEQILEHEKNLGINQNE
jgi:chloramphenicol O-acetyltransferase type B